MVLGSVPSFQVRCESGAGAGPWRTVPSRWKRDPWQGQSKGRAFLLKGMEQPGCEQLMAKTSIFLLLFTQKPPNVSSPAALSPPPSAMMKAELGLDGASNLSASPSAIWLTGLGVLIGRRPF